MVTDLDFAGFQRLPVDSTEPWVAQDIFRTPYQVTQPLGTVGMKECANEVTRERVNMRWPGNLAS